MDQFNLRVVAHIMRAGGTHFTGNANAEPLSKANATALQNSLQRAIAHKKLDFLVLFSNQSEIMLTEKMIEDSVFVFTIVYSHVEP